jgi:nickel-responsive transcriptional regulator NikR
MGTRLLCSEQSFKMVGLDAYTELALQFDEFIAAKGYGSRSEAVRDLIRSRLGSATLDAPSKGAAAWCVANVSHVYDHHEHTVTARVMDLQHDHHDLVTTSLHRHLDHDHCLETVVLRGHRRILRTGFRWTRPSTLFNIEVQANSL